MMSPSRWDSFESFLARLPSSGDPLALSRTSFSPPLERVNSCAPPEERGDKLKQQYLEELRSILTSTAKLRQTVVSLVKISIKPNELVSWAVEAGFDELRVRKLLSEILLDAGIRRRRSGAGRPTPPEALLLFAYAKEHYGERALRFLRAAYRVARADKKNQTIPLIRIRISGGLPD